MIDIKAKPTGNGEGQAEPETEICPHEVSAKRRNQDHNKTAMKQRVEIRKRKCTATTKNAQETTHRTRSQTISNHQQPKTYHMDSKAMNALLAKQIPASLQHCGPYSNRHFVTV